MLMTGSRERGSHRAIGASKGVEALGEGGRKAAGGRGS